MENQMYLHRTLVISGKKTSIALERVFWEALDDISEGKWRSWVLNALTTKREDIGRATYLRTKLFVDANRGRNDSY
jgi:predicted DNA-binding ribbon-helix-helix protein